LRIFRSPSRPTRPTAKLYGSVSATDLLAAIEANRGIKLSRSQLDLPDHLKEVGEYDANIELGHGVIVKFKVTILDEGAQESAE
jgi:ribosomal protein L9